MLVVKILVVFCIFVYFSSGSKTCQVSEIYSYARINMRNAVDNYGAINFASDYVFLHKENNYSRKILQYLKYPKSVIKTNYIRMHLIEIHGMENKFEFKAYSLDEIVGYQTFDVKVNLNFLNQEKCMEKVQTVAWRIASKESVCIMILACHIAQSDVEKPYKMKRRLIFIVDEKFDLSTLNSLLTGFKYEPKNSTFHGYYLGKGFCMCEYLDEFFNGCQVEPLDVRVAVAMVFLLIVSLCTVVQIYLKVIFDDTTEY